MLQHCSMKEGSVRGGQQGLFGPKEGVAEQLWAATARPRGPRQWKGRGEGVYTASRTVCMAPAARRPPGRWHGVPGPARAEAAVAGFLGARSGHRRRRGQRPSRDSPAPGGRPRDQGGDPAPQAGADRARRDPGEARGSPPAGSWSLDAWAPGCCSAHRPPPFRVAPARVASQGQQPQLPEDEEVGEGGRPGGWGRGLEAPGWVRRSLHHSRPVGHAQAVPDEAGNFPTWWGKHQNKRPSGAGARPPQPSSPSTRPPPVPARGHDLGRPLRGGAAGIWSPDATTGPASLAAAPPPQLTLPAPAAIVTLTETYPVHRHGNAHPSRALLPPLPRRSPGTSRDRRRGSHDSRGQKRGQGNF